MAQLVPREQVLSVLKRRYDHQSAQVILKRVVEAEKLKDQEHYTSEDLRSLGQGLQKIGDRLDPVLAALTALAGSASSTTRATEAAPSQPAPLRVPVERPAVVSPAVSASEPPSAWPPREPATTIATVTVATSDAEGVAGTPTTAESSAEPAASTADEATGDDAPSESAEGEPSQAKGRSGQRRRR